MIKSATKIIAAILLTLFVSWIFFVINCRNQDVLRDDFHCDNIAVLTGGKNRIKTALDAANKLHAKNVFISGVYEKTTLKDILPQNIDCQSSIVLGHSARNTYENAKEISKWATENNIRDIVVVTSDYHILRSCYELHRRNPNLKIYTVKVPSTFNKRFLVLSMKEFYKMMCIFANNIVRGNLDND